MKQILLFIPFFCFFCFSVFALSPLNDSTRIGIPVKKAPTGNDQLVWTKVESEAMFPGGVMAWNRFLQKNVKSNIAFLNKALKGKYLVLVKFTINKEGNISDAVAETNHGYGMEEEVLRVIKTSPQWTPAMDNGEKGKCLSS